MVIVTEGWVEFSFYRPQAKNVFLVGEFNEWRSQDLRMAQSSEGYWQAKMHLPAGEFKFRYRADGEWFADYAAFGVEPSRFGLDSIVRVPTVPVKLPVHAATPSQSIAAA